MLYNSTRKGIFAQELGKNYGSHSALQSINLDIEEGSICGLVGTNGAGKSTLLRLLAGVFPQTSGILRVFDSHPFSSGNHASNKIIFIPDIPYFLQGSTINKMAEFFGGEIECERLKELCEKLNLDMNEKIARFSKGVKQLSAIVLALSRHPKILIADETFDGLDPVSRTAVKKLIIDEVQSRKMTVIISSHSLREIEDFCDTLIVLHKGEIIEQADISSLKESIFKGQIAFSNKYDVNELAKEHGFKVLSSEKSDSLTIFTAEGNIMQSREQLSALSPTLLNLQPLTLEEIFTQRVSFKGYDFSNILGGNANE